MSDQSVRDLYDLYPAQDRNDFYVAYLYLKHMNIFSYNVMKMLGMPVLDPEEDWDPSIRTMLEQYTIQIAQAAPDRATNIYHGKVMSHGDARSLVSIDAPVRVTAAEKVVPFSIARDVVLDSPVPIAVGRCACRINKPDPCVPPEEQEVCLIMGDPFISFVAEHNPLFRRCSTDEALSILEKAHRRGDVHTAYFKKEFAGRLMAICNCCRCCCMGMVMWNKLNGAVPFLASSGYRAEPTDACTGCGACADRCPFYALSQDDTSGKIAVNQEKCMGCGVCEGICPSEGIGLVRDPSKGEPLDSAALRD